MLNSWGKQDFLYCPLGSFAWNILTLLPTLDGKDEMVTGLFSTSVAIALDLK